MGVGFLHSSGNEYELLNACEFIRAVSNTVFDMINDAYYDKPLIFTGIMFWETLISIYQAVNETDSFLLMENNLIEAMAVTLAKESHSSRPCSVRCETSKASSSIFI